MIPERLCRFSVSMPRALAAELDALVAATGQANRSQAIADLVRARLVEHHTELGDHEIAGTITLVYDHHKPHLQAALTGIQHDHHAVIVSTMHVHLDHHNCLEVLVVRGQGNVIRRIAEELLAAKGVKHGRLTVTTTGRDFEG